VSQSVKSDEEVGEAEWDTIGRRRHLFNHLQRPAVTTPKKQHHVSAGKNKEKTLQCVKNMCDDSAWLAEETNANE